MKSICIKTNNNHTLNYLENELKNITIDNLLFSRRNFAQYQNIIIHYKGKNEQLFLEKLSNLLSFLIIDELEETFFKQIISENFFYFNTEEQECILSNCFSKLSKNYLDLFDKKLNTLSNSFFKYLSSNKSIVLNGFITFRLNEYFDILNEIVNEAVSSYLVEKEYFEFISLLKIYINSKKPLIDTVHLIYSLSESVLLDENKNIIAFDTDIFDAKYLSDITFSTNDYTLNSLLNLVPKKIYIHFTETSIIDEFINTLSLIFENRVYICGIDT